MIPLPNHNPAIFSVPSGTENLNKFPRQKNYDNSNMLDMFNSDTYTDFITTYKHVLVPS